MVCGRSQFESAHGLSFISSQARKSLKSSGQAASVVESSGEMQRFLVGGVGSLVISFHTIDMTKIGQRTSAAPAVPGIAEN